MDVSGNDVMYKTEGTPVIKLNVDSGFENTKKTTRLLLHVLYLSCYDNWDRLQPITTLIRIRGRESMDGWMSCICILNIRAYKQVTGSNKK